MEPSSIFRRPSVRQSVSRSVGQSVSRSVGQCQSVNQSVSVSLVVTLFVSRSPVSPCPILCLPAHRRNPHTRTGSSSLSFSPSYIADSSAENRPSIVPPPLGHPLGTIFSRTDLLVVREGRLKARMVGNGIT